ncbi:hypothetical protein B0J12DRAFT_137682 [Macrophomina phaseolina]|uniref:Fungal N-terminal domain-containing protein n=1 Tax=Macrophomina phaseolina TaxID=35725 RepID=A0ABQ8GA12_9PEZI|nr:hypothetical protein B0J12DRAFT_137682 [Macrophomina phaseolina]
MSGLEVVGAAASVTQLVQYCVKLGALLQDICQNADKLAKQYEGRKQHIDQVLHMAQLISRTENFHQSRLIQDHVISLTKTTLSIHSEINQIKWFLCSTSKVRKCLRALEYPKFEESIAKGFADLERDKSCLALCLLGTFGHRISEIQSALEAGLPSIQEEIGSIKQHLHENSEIAERSREIERGYATMACGHGECSTQLPLLQLGASFVQSQNGTVPCGRRRTNSEVGSEASASTSATPASEEDRPGRYPEAWGQECDGKSATCRDEGSALPMPALRNRLQYMDEYSSYGEEQPGQWRHIRCTPCREFFLAEVVIAFLDVVPCISTIYLCAKRQPATFSPVWMSTYETSSPFCCKYQARRDVLMLLHNVSWTQQIQEVHPLRLRKHHSVGRTWRSLVRIGIARPKGYIESASHPL